MPNLSNSQRELVAIGAAIGSNCVPCIQHHIPEARKAGLTDDQIRTAVRLADKVRQVPARNVLKAATELLEMTESGNQTVESAGCGELAAGE